MLSNSGMTAYLSEHVWRKCYRIILDMASRSGMKCHSKLYNCYIMWLLIEDNLSLISTNYKICIKQ